MSGRAIASPTIVRTWTLCSCTAFQISWASKRGTKTTGLPVNSAPNAAHCAAPWISGAAGSRVRLPALPCSASVHSSGMYSPVTKLIPPPSARQTSSCRQSTPFG